MSSLVANYSDSESEHSSAEDEEETENETPKNESGKTEVKENVNFLTAEFSESEEEGE